MGVTGHARLPRAVRLLHQASSSNRAGAGSSRTDQPQGTPGGGQRGLGSLSLPAPACQHPDQAPQAASQRGLPADRLARAAAGLRPGPIMTPTAAAKLALRLLGERYQALGAELAEVDAELDRFTALAAPRLRQLCGIGPEIAGALLAAVGDNPERLRSEAAFSMLCGAAPIPASSGKTVRHRLNRGGNRQANTALYRIVVVRLRWHQPTRDYLVRRTKEGLYKREIIRCVKRYVAREVFAALHAPTAPTQPA